MLTFVVNGFYGLFSHVCVFSYNESVPAKIRNDIIINSWPSLYFNILLNSSGISRPQ